MRMSSVQLNMLMNDLDMLPSIVAWPAGAAEVTVCGSLVRHVKSEEMFPVTSPTSSKRL